MSVFKYYLNNIEFTPINTGDFTFDINLETDSGAYHYSRSINGVLLFDSAAYSFILNYSDCQEISLRIDDVCTQGTFQVLDLYFTNRDCKFFPDLLQVEVTTRQRTLYQCLVDNYDRNFNFLDVPNIVTAEYETTTNFEYLITIPANPTAPADEPGFGSYVETSLGASPFFGFALYVREVITTYCLGGKPQEPEGAGWVLLVDNCAGAGVSKWYRKAPVFEGPPPLSSANFSTTSCVLPCVPPVPPVTGANEDWFLMDTFDNGINIIGFWVDYNVIKGDNKDFLNGRLLTDVINLGLNQHCSRLDLQSQFLSNVINPVTGNIPSSTEGIQMHAIGDIKDSTADVKASREDVKLSDILEGYISGKLNCFWFVDENAKRLIIEHYNDLNNAPPFDLTAIEGGLYTDNKNTYEYDNTDVPKAEEFPSLDSSIDFTGVDINFDNPCASGTKTYRTDQFYSEVELIVTDPDEYPRDGVVMITPDSLAPFSSTSTVNTRSEIGAITSVYYPNAPQAMANLHDKFWKFYRPFNFGELNFINQTFTKPNPKKKLQTIKVPLCCFFSFNPRSSFIGNNFTNGQLRKASYNQSSGQITLDIQYHE